MILQLFLAFLEIGAVSFGGGYGMIALIREKVVESGWLPEEEFLNLVAVSESTPGPIAVNMATFVGSAKAGILGSLAATLGVILPSFIIILLIAALLRNLLKYPAVGALLRGIRPSVVGLILATALSLFATTLLGLNAGERLTVSPDIAGMVIFAVVIAVMWLWKRRRSKPMPSIAVILVSAGLGILAGVFGL